MLSEQEINEVKFQLKHLKLSVYGKFLDYFFENDKSLLQGFRGVAFDNSDSPDHFTCLWSIHKEEDTPFTADYPFDVIYTRTEFDTLNNNIENCRVVIRKYLEEQPDDENTGE